MKTLLNNIATTTEDLNIFGKAIVYSILAVILIMAAALAIGVVYSIITNNPIEIRY